MNGYVLHLPEDESIVLSGPVSRRLVEAGDGEAALLYIAVLRNKGSIDDQRLRSQLGWQQNRFDRALGVLVNQGLVALPRHKTPPQKAPPEPEDRRPEYTRADMARALEGPEFASLTSAVEEKLGKKLTTPDLAILLGLYDQLGLPADVIFLLVGFCTERTAAQRGPGCKPTMRQIEKEGYLWARLELMDQGSAAAYIKKYQRNKEALPRLMRLLRLGDRQPSPSEERYLLAWNDMGFDPEALEAAYDKTILNCKELKWRYMNKILCSWHQKGLHTMEEIAAGDRHPAASRQNPGVSRPASRQNGPQQSGAVREDMARMEKYLEQLRREKGGT